MGRAPSLTAPNSTLTTDQSTKQQQLETGGRGGTERGGSGGVTLSNKHTARETTETVIPPKALTLQRETNKSILLFQDKRSHDTRGGIIYCSYKPKEEGCSWMQF